ncbi:MAG: coniferyl aldehyde dehydrogenase [Oleispira antarctica]|uniref:Aldehyde dehydrogenase n=1 Tax=Oleispira antarctica RB-8 TaxID=698738 RepID=R4YMB5_OLEAN|nr:coniferyl aldehyde dehydrogenase [Oleispira antarctica]MBQ0792447.1 coniferyl aldehyde dehydrogenase [Oleispira antarctica]CCK74228.1 Aldehyde dehydrogenase [Oleispira antarctica RB-8]
MVANAAEVTSLDTEIIRLKELFIRQKSAYGKSLMPTAEQRIGHLKALKNVTIKYQDQLAAAVNEDFSCRSKDETLLAEILTSVEGINMAIKKTRKWMKPSKRGVGMLFAPAKNEVRYQPLGVVGIIVPWNYPIFLAIGPLVAALAAGNRAMIKMSEFTPNLNKVFKAMIAEIFEENRVCVIEGEADAAIVFTEQPFDHILFTGSTTVGRFVMAAAAKNLTPVTLELGGKSPAIVSKNIPMKDAAERICFGKSMNAGQTCVAPDYILVPKAQEEEFIQAYIAAFTKMYPTLKDNNDYTAIVNDRQYQRLTNWIEDAKDKGAKLTEINPAKEDLSAGRKLAPVIVQNMKDTMTIAEEELFGPILPIITYDSMDEAIAHVNDRPRPLALYFFGYDKNEQNYVLDNTHSGGVCVNDTLMHLAQEDMPFGGVGDSGMGHYHGKEGFITFSKAKAVHRKGRFSTGNLAYPPYDNSIRKMIYTFFIR